MPFHISLQRVLLMTALSYGLYLFYWFYITWKHFRDHTQAEAYPVWHTLTLFVPIYGLFRTYAHARTFRDLMRDADISGSIKPWLAVVLVVIVAVLDNISFRASFSLDPMTQDDAIAIAVIDFISIALTAGLLLYLQSNLNRYWQGFTYLRVTSAKIGVGEITFGIIGVLIWLVTFANIFSESWRIGL